MARFVVLVNDGAGSDAGGDRGGELGAIRKAFAGTGIDVDVSTERPDCIGDAVRRIWADPDRPDAIVVAGGDGTVNAAAGAALGCDALLGVLPMGTFNHFASDLGLPADLAGAACALAERHERRVDVGEVGGRVVVNNATLGVYPEMVSVRDRLREQRGWGKVRAVPAAVWRVARSFPVHRLVLSTGGGGRPADGRPLRTPLVFVGNGSYADGPGGPTTRTALDAGRLEVLVARVVSRRGLVRAVLAALVAHPDAVRDLDHHQVTDLRVDGRADRLRVALDGEICWLDLPLRFRSRPGALRVLVGREDA